MDAPLQRKTQKSCKQNLSCSEGTVIKIADRGKRENSYTGIIVERRRGRVVVVVINIKKSRRTNGRIVSLGCLQRTPQKLVSRRCLFDLSM